MKKFILTNSIWLLALSILVACSHTQQNKEPTMELTNKAKAIALLNAIETGDQQAINYINPNKYVQHNLAVADGITGFAEVLQSLPKDSAKVRVVRAFADGDFVFTHTEYNFFGPKIGFDLFRFENGLIVEHWDNLIEIAASPNPSGHSQIDGPTSVVDVEKTIENKALVADFVDAILVKGQYDKLAQYFDGDNYIQHNSMIADGLSGLSQALASMAEQGITMQYTTNHKVLGEGNFVLAISEGSFGGEATSYYDLFRIQDGKIAEHWDVMETLAKRSEWRNSNGKFGGL